MSVNTTVQAILISRTTWYYTGGFGLFEAGGNDLFEHDLNNFREHGSWDNRWFNPQGLFDWTAVDRFEIVSEYHALKGIQFWFDDIRVVDR
jgi:hypothetical protein